MAWYLELKMSSLGGMEVKPRVSKNNLIFLADNKSPEKLLNLSTLKEIALGFNFAELPS